jgi:hypothetical protein
MADLDFTIDFDGPGVANHEIDARVLAPTLLGIADLVQDIGHNEYPLLPPVSVVVAATEQGSFGLRLGVLYGEAHGGLASLGADVGNLRSIITVVGQLIRLARLRLHGEPTSVEVVAETPEIGRVHYPDGFEADVPLPVIRAGQRWTVKRSLSEVVRPVGVNGIEQARILQDALEVAVVDTDDVPLIANGPPTYLPSQSPVPVVESTTPMLLTIVAPAFDGKKWRVSDGDHSFRVAIEDPAFVAGIDSRSERFSKGDRLRCQVRVQQFEGAKGLQIDRTIVEVIEHIQPGPSPQGDLFDG